MIRLTPFIHKGKIISIHVSMSARIAHFPVLEQSYLLKISTFLYFLAFIYLKQKIKNDHLCDSLWNNL